MDLAEFILIIIIIFIINYCATMKAINPLLDYVDNNIKHKKECDLVKLRDLKILDDNELEDVIKLVKKRNEEREQYESYNKCLETLEGIKDVGYFTEEQYLCRLQKLKEHFKI
ncbi:hypothetical protein [Inconstantimicrobium mannanitabidum]|uniref:Uncharacterized protein n=1 Tax=Inconstantimicrobium mannanitabidum TaxID=1604901 RepID=A0ACB5RHG7_9CLOT|nr:hypothetical protein [Clostridium sp. TW13]GKX68551.1 hypothetical protein rsdtw13_38090 [Clostridium sp. TW13]